MIKALALGLIVLVQACAAHAQQGSSHTWTDPLKRVSLVVAGGWTRGRGGGLDTIGVFEHGATGDAIVCHVEYRELAVPAMTTQEQLNARVGDFLPAHRIGWTTLETSSHLIDGVALAGGVVEVSDDPDMLYYYRIFGVAGDGSIDGFQIRCATSRPVSDERRALLSTFFDSIRIRN